MKLKTGFKDHDYDVMRIKYIRQHHPKMGIRIDYNQGLALEKAEYCVAAVADFAPDFIEQPVAAHQKRMMAKLRKLCPCPLLADESVFGPEDMASAIADEICDGISIKIMKTGGLQRAQTTARMAHFAGLSAYGGDMSESGLGHAAGAQMIAATAEIALGCEFYQAKYFVCEDLLSTPFVIDDGFVVVSDAVGLGVQVNEELLQKYQKVSCHD